MNRRNWLKSGLALAGSYALAPQISAGMSRSSGSVIWEVEHESYYSGAAPGLKARLNANENPYGPSERVRKAISDSLSLGNRYGHGDAAVLIKMIAEKEGVSAEHIMLGPGSTDLLEKTAISRFIKGGNVVSADPSYMSLINTAQAIGAEWKAIPLKPDHSHDLDAMADAVDGETQLVYVCNPNNPTGSITAPAELRSFCTSVSEKVPVFVDEAYLEFLDDPEANSMVDLVRSGKDVVVARTFSKIYSMAGLRIGYIVASPARIKSITDLVRSTMGLCVTSVSGAIASLKDQDFCASCKVNNLKAKQYLTSQLDELGYQYIPSHTNFVIFPLRKGTDGKQFLGKLADEGVGVRMFQISDAPWCRVSIGTMPEMELFVNAFKSVTV